MHTWIVVELRFFTLVENTTYYSLKENKNPQTSTYVNKTKTFVQFTHYKLNNCILNGKLKLVG